MNWAGGGPSVKQPVTLLPLMVRELRVRARNPATFWGRVALGVAGLAFCSPMMTGYAGSGAGQASRGEAAYAGMLAAAFTLCSLAGLLTLAGVAREREEGTLELLFLADVGPLELLAASFGAAGMTCVFGLLALAPIFVLPVVAGGVTGGEAARTTLVLFDTMGLSLAVGLWAAARRRKALKAAALALAVMGVIVIAPMLTPRGGPLEWISPYAALQGARDVAQGRSAGSYWLALAVMHGLTWHFLLGAATQLKRAMMEAGQTAEGVVARPSRKALGDGENPLAWLWRRKTGTKAAVWAATIGMGLVAWSAVLAQIFQRGWSPLFANWGGRTMGLIMQCVFAWAITRFFIEARRTRELELLMTTPRGATEMIATQWHLLWRLFFWPTMILLSNYVEWAVAVIRNSFGNAALERAFFAAWVLGTIASMAALIWLGLWFGWTARSQWRAILLVVGWVYGAPFVINLTFQLLWPGNRAAQMCEALGALALFIGLAVWARRRLLREFGRTREKESALPSLFYGGAAEQP